MATEVTCRACGSVQTRILGLNHGRTLYTCDGCKTQFFLENEADIAERQYQAPSAPRPKHDWFIAHEQEIRTDYARDPKGAHQKWNLTVGMLTVRNIMKVDAARALHGKPPFPSQQPKYIDEVAGKLVGQIKEKYLEANSPAQAEEAPQGDAILEHWQEGNRLMLAEFQTRETDLTGRVDLGNKLISALELLISSAEEFWK